MPLVTIRSLGSFAADHGQTLLDAAERGGVALPSDCCSGTCGTCKLQIVQGAEHLSILGYDKSVLSDEERRCGKTLACRAQVRGDVELDRLEILAEPRRLEGRVIGLTKLLDIIKLVIEPRTPMPFRSGQYAKVTVGGIPARSYSMTNQPSEPHLEFHIRHRQGPASVYIREHLKIGDRVQLEGPHGLCVLKETPEIVAAANGVGFAPLKSIINAALANPVAPRIRLVWGLRSAPSIYEPETLAAWRARGVDVRLAFSQPCAGTARSHPEEAARPGYAQGALDAWLAQTRPGPGAIGYVCGAPAMVVEAQQVLARHGVGTVLADSFVRAAHAAPNAGWRQRFGRFLGG